METHTNTTQEVCGIPLGGSHTCERAPHTGVHAYALYSLKIMYSADNPAEQVYGYCYTCFELLTDENQAVGVASAHYCRTHVGPAQAEYRARNSCAACGFEGPHALRNYSMIWSDGDIHCGACGTYIRMFDAG